MLSYTLKTPALVATLVLAGCVTPAEQQGAAVSVPAVAQVQATPAAADPIVAANYGGGNFSWGQAGGLLYRFAAVERDGEVQICGAYTRKGSSDLSRLSREAMRQATVTANGETIMRDLRFFTPASSANWNNQLVGVETNCRSTGMAAGSIPLNAVNVNLRNGRYRIRL